MALAQVLDLDETLVHSSFKPVADADYIIPVDIDGRVLDVYVLKRPHLDEFLRHVGAKFEVSDDALRDGPGGAPALALLTPCAAARRSSCSPRPSPSTRTLCWTSWMCPRWSGGASSARHASRSRETT